MTFQDPAEGADTKIAVVAGESLTLTLARDAVRSVPALAILVVVVFIFFQHLDRRDGKFAQSLEAIGDACHAQQMAQNAKLIEVVAENREALKENTKLLGQVLEALRN